MASMSTKGMPSLRLVRTTRPACLYRDFICCRSTCPRSVTRSCNRVFWINLSRFLRSGPSPARAHSKSRPRSRNPAHARIRNAWSFVACKRPTARSLNLWQVLSVSRSAESELNAVSTPSRDTVTFPVLISGKCFKIYLRLYSETVTQKRQVRSFRVEIGSVK